MGGKAETTTVTLSGSITTGSDVRLYPATPAIVIKGNIEHLSLDISMNPAAHNILDLPVPDGYTPKGTADHERSPCFTY